jgi:hypothetical protein
MMISIRRLYTLLALTLLCAPLLAQHETLTSQPLFHIERSKNANIVQYDAQVAADGKLFKKKPVVGYWIRLNEQGQKQELNWLQRTFAYGFDAKPDKGRESAEINMKADVGQAIKVVREGDTYRATVTIDGAPSYFEKMYIDATRHGLSLDVRYVELFGEDMKTGEARYEKIVP